MKTFSNKTHIDELILSSIDCEYLAETSVFSLETLENCEYSRITALYGCIYKEYAHELKRLKRSSIHGSKTKWVRNYLQGLPSSCTVLFSDHDIIQFGIEKYFIKASADDDAQQHWVNVYWDKCAFSINNLYRIAEGRR